MTSCERTNSLFLAVTRHYVSIGSILLNFPVLKNMAGVLLISLSPFITPVNWIRSTIRIVAMKSHLMSAIEDKTVNLGVLVANAL